MDIDQIGDFLEHQGMSDEFIDQFFEHHGVRGQKWGVRRAARQQNRALNRASRQQDRQKFTKSVETARAKFSSGDANREWKAAKAQFHKDKATKGSREARKILNKTRDKQQKEFALSQQAKDGKEVAGFMLASVVGSVAVGFLASR